VTRANRERRPGGSGRRAREAAAARARRRQQRAWLAASVLALAALVGLIVVAGGSSAGGRGISDPEAFDLPAIEGEERVRLSDFEGDPVVVNFFASWCTSCDFELPGFARVSDELRGKVAFVGVNALETGDRMLMPERHGVTWWTLARDIGSRGNDLHAALGGRGMPLTAFYDAAGRLLHVDPGALDEATLRERIATLYGEDT
jgi:cytochrome c biogenesis protein CcmG, thiol:disulfide interchange protein DsbE